MIPRNEQLFQVFHCAAALNCGRLTPWVNPLKPHRFQDKPIDLPTISQLQKMQIVTQKARTIYTV
jgi:hypothetical protein